LVKFWSVQGLLEGCNIVKNQGRLPVTQFARKIILTSDMAGVPEPFSAGATGRGAS
jgi:hypothetical protein